MPGGGSGPGERRGGRQKGTPNKATAAREAEIAATGQTPLDVMIEVMRFHHSEAKKLIDRLFAGDVSQSEAIAEGPHAPIVEALRQLVGMSALAVAAAKAATPYVHPRAGIASDDNVSDPEFVPLAERLADYQRRDDIEAVRGKVFAEKTDEPVGDKDKEDAAPAWVRTTAIPN